MYFYGPRPKYCREAQVQLTSFDTVAWPLMRCARVYDRVVSCFFCCLWYLWVCAVLARPWRGPVLHHHQPGRPVTGKGIILLLTNIHVTPKQGNTGHLVITALVWVRGNNQSTTNTDRMVGRLLAPNSEIYPQSQFRETNLHWETRSAYPSLAVAANTTSRPECFCYSFITCDGSRRRPSGNTLRNLSWGGTQQ